MGWIRQCLVLGHLGCGFLLLLGVAWPIAVTLGVLPASTGSYFLALFNPGLFFLGPTLTCPLQAALGAWMLVLARWLWTGHPRLRRALLVTHGFLLLFGAFLVVVGFYAVAAAERSTGRGGGLLSPLALLPFLCGVPLVSFALCSIVFALAAIPGRRLVPR